ncbi:phage antirepressor KilAC domain-containing protein [Paenibacillus shunpengii]|uniref:Phage antirepressor KilAC domain-containing protein n=1 Tax=Paenibacillus shunpengii TaxID=2054424 RepID=A0ABW5SV44_9BACL
MSQLVFIENGRVVTDSLTVAKEFGKTHAHVLRDIEVQLRKLDEADEREWGVSNFGEAYYQNEQNKSFYRKYLLSEDGFALLVMSYTTPDAIRFKLRFLEEFREMGAQLRSSTAVVVPSYMIQDEVQRAERWIEERRELLAKEGECQLLMQKIEEQSEKLSYLDQILSSESTICITQIAADYGLSARELNEILKEESIQRKVNKQWILKVDYMNRGYTKSESFNVIQRNGKEKSVVHTRWTQKGRLLIHETLERRGIRANVDREGQRPGEVTRKTSRRKRVTEPRTRTLSAPILTLVQKS